MRCIMDQLHEELKQPMLLLPADPVSTDSDGEEPNHQNKRLLGGTTLTHDENQPNGVLYCNSFHIFSY